jgi:hypothetical protein
MPSPRQGLRASRKLDKYRLHQLASGFPLPTAAACGWGLPRRWREDEVASIMADMAGVYQQHREEVWEYARQHGRQPWARRFDQENA